MNPTQLNDPLEQLQALQKQLEQLDNQPVREPVWYRLFGCLSLERVGFIALGIALDILIWQGYNYFVYNPVIKELKEQSCSFAQQPDNNPLEIPDEIPSQQQDNSKSRY